MDRVAWMRPALAAMCMASCGGEDDARGSGSASFPTSLTLGSGDTGDATEVEDDDNPPSTETDSSPPGDDGVVFDLGVMPDHSMPVEEGCHKVDFLFVIDDSGSMGDDQDNLAANFPAFITGIQSTLENVDEYQVGVVTTDQYEFNGANCQVFGGLVIQTGGDDSSNAVCGPYANGSNYMTEADDLDTEFACAAQVGSDGDGCERPMNALETVVRKDVGGAGQCNDGYLRDDALLVVVIITDEWDGAGDPEGDCNPSSGDPMSWYDTVVTAKQGIAENVVVLSLIHHSNGCDGEDGPALLIEEFTNLFGVNGFIGCITGDYGMIFTEAIGVIDEACNNFVPPG